MGTEVSGHRTSNSDLTHNLMLVSSAYDDSTNHIQLKFYDTVDNKIILWTDNSNHKPYCYSKEKVEVGEGIIAQQSVEKYDPLSDRKIMVNKIVMKTPWVLLGQEGLKNSARIWEGDIRYPEQYLYDKGYLCGSIYQIIDGRPRAVCFPISPELEKALAKAVGQSKPDMREAISEWSVLLNQPLPIIRQIGLPASNRC